MGPSMSHWVSDLIGIPFEEHGRTRLGCDCWGLVRLGLERGFGLLVPDYSEGYLTSTDREEIQALMHRETVGGWREVPIGEASAGDVLLFRIQGQVCHAGLAIAPPVFLHAQRGLGSALERWDRLIWTRRLSSVLRHPALERGRPEAGASRSPQAAPLLHRTSDGLSVLSREG